MSILDETAFVERLTFFNGQRLFASDLQGIEAFNREMRWLHNQSLHQPGIGRGLAVTGKRDDREVRVGPGYALDALGREIVLTREQVEPVPPVASEDGGQSVCFDLAVSYPDDSQLVEAETRDGICLPRGVVRLREEPVLCWIRLQRDAAGNLSPSDPGLREDIKNGLRIVLARVEVLQCRLRQDVSLAERRSARPARQPYIACGSQTPAWQQESITENLFKLTAAVDTASAGFLTTPCYSVRLDGERVKIADGQAVSFVFDAPPSVLEPGPTGFKLEVLVSVSGRSPGAGEAPPWASWTAAWMGVE
ncbi:MAG TPA: hypothetical protein VHG32_15705 [Thermoanaerobaculia bacterium]|jgi:hypothetical protein|nr:hypothetical protein [Thermoanaerobaculia bacterium]